MKRVLDLLSMLLVFVTGLVVSLPAQQAAQGSAQPGAAVNPSKIESAATDALDKMGAYLRTLKAFQIRTEGTSEIVMMDGQKVQIARRANMVARMPDRLLAEIEGDQGSKVMVFDGKTFSYLARDAGYYATVDAPPTLGKLAHFIDDNYGLEVPLADLFLWGSANNTPPKLTAATDIGPSQVGGVSCEHYAFRQEGLDWQVWVQKGDYPLPLKLVLTTTTDEARPQHTSVLTWNLAPSYNEATFVFNPPDDAHKIVFAKKPASSGGN